MTKAEYQCRDYLHERRSTPVEQPDAFVGPSLAGYSACRTSDIRVPGLSSRFVNVDINQEMNAAQCRKFAAWLLKAAEWMEDEKCPR